MLEILVNNRAIAKLIQTDQTHQIASQLQMGRDQGMQTMDSALLEAINNKEIDPDDAIRFANDKKKFQRLRHRYRSRADSRHRRPVEGLTPCRISTSSCSKRLKKTQSDLHFISGDPVRARVHGGLKPLRDDRLTTEFVSEAVFEIMDGAAQKTFEEQDAADFAYEIPDVSRFRVNAFRHLNGIGAIFRAIPSTALTLEDLNMPNVVHQLCRHTQGMILVTGKNRLG